MHTKQGLTHAEYRNFAKNLERELNDALTALAMLGDRHERELAEAQNMINLLRESHDVVTKQFLRVDAELAALKGEKP
jgi:hypothetical protein